MTEHKNSIEKSPPPELQQKAEWLRNKIEKSIEKTRKNRSSNKKKASYVKIITIIFSGFITILLGLQIQGFEDLFKGVALILGAFVSMLNAFEPFFNFRALWVESEATLGAFHLLQEEVEFYMTGTDPEEWSEEKINNFNSEYQQIWQKYSHTWIEYRKTDDKVK
ncbi:MAG: DUF4231 domain-containing protein [Desulfobacteraceae bacterium]|nr:DUF4231 domain-containing protein [Desulfobacteraceae bacterium]